MYHKPIQLFVIILRLNKEKMRKLLPILVLLFMAVSLDSCKKDEEEPCPNTTDMGTLRVSFTSTVGGDSLVLFDRYTDQLDRGYNIERLKFYITNSMLSFDGNAFELDSIRLIDFENTASLVKEYELEAGTYSSLQFGVGLDADRNARHPSEFPDSHPMADIQGMFWDWSINYKFVLIEGRTAINSTASYGDIYAYHTGLNEMYTERTFDGNIDIIKNQVTEIKVNLDIEKIFFGSDTLDFRVDKTWHGQEPNKYVGEAFTDNFVNAFTIF